MALEKEDLKQIKGIVDESIGDLADAVANGFESVDKRFDAIDKRFDANDAAHRRFNARLDLIETDLSNLRNLHKEIREIRALLDEIVTRKEFEKLEQRLSRVEHHLELTN